MKKITQTIILTAFVVLLLASCDPASTIKYEIWNKTAKPIKVEFYFVFSSTNDTIIQETIIKPDELKTINEELHLGFARQIDESRDSIYFYSLRIMQDSSVAMKNLKNKKYWKFETQGKYIGIYILKIEKNFFFPEGK
jgi:hypothetical protein